MQASQASSGACGVCCEHASGPATAPHLRVLGCLAAQWQQPPPSAKPKRVRPSASRYAALSDQGLDIRAAFQPEAGPSPLALSPGLVESEDL